MREYLSVSQISLYLTCPRHYYFRYIEERPPERHSAALAFGKAMHSALASFHVSKKDGQALPTEKVQLLFRADWAAEANELLSFSNSDTSEGMLELGQTLLAEYVSLCDFDVLSAEKEFEVPLCDPETGEILADKPLVGVFDLETPAGIVEFKTAKSIFSAEQLARHLQLSAYTYSYRLTHGRLPAVTVVYFLKLKKPRVERQEVNRTMKEVKFFLNTAAQVAKAIAAELFPASPGWSCSNCEHAQACLER